ncbi:MAG: hypothetical protein ACYC5N_00930, partial [Endomicrobiales bacterium]
LFDSAMVKKIIETFNPVQYKEYYFKYDIGGWHRSTIEEAEKMTFFDKRKKSEYDEDYAIAARAIACLELEK